MENFYFILFAMTGKQPPYIKREIEDKIMRMFKMIDRLWCSIEKDRRISFLNYYFIIYKLLELMGQTELMIQVPLLKTRLRLRQHDTLWNQVCEKLGWSWLPTEIPLDKPKRVAKRKPKVALQKWAAKCLAKFLTVDCLIRFSNNFQRTFVHHITRRFTKQNSGRFRGQNPKVI